MALINCEECGTQVSEKAPACTKCGAPIASLNDITSAGVKLTTIQETGKKFKLQTLISVSLIIIGFVWMFNADPQSTGMPALVTSLGIMWYVINRFRIWWHHK